MAYFIEAKPDKQTNQKMLTPFNMILIKDDFVVHIKSTYKTCMKCVKYRKHAWKSKGYLISMFLEVVSPYEYVLTTSLEK